MNEEPDPAHLLVVDDDLDIRDSLQEYLTASGFAVSVAKNAGAARRQISEQSFDLVLLDIMMPGEDGISLCRSILNQKATPVIFLSARSEDVDRVVGLEIGADDYLGKPFMPRELLARIRSVLRRTGGEEAVRDVEKRKFYEFECWSLDVAKRNLRRDDGVTISLSSSEFALLLIFVQRPGIVLSRDRILELSRADGIDIFDRSVDSQISRFRKKLEIDPKNPTVLKTVWGGGYVFAAEVKAL